MARITRRPAAIVAASLLLVGVVLTVADPTLDVPDGVTLGAIGLTIVVAAWIIKGGFAADLLAPRVFFPLVLLGFYGVGSLPLTSWGHVSGGMYLLVLLAVASFLSGAAMVGGRTDYPALRERIGRAQFDQRRAATVLLLLASAGAAAFAITFLQTGIPIFGAVDAGRLASADDGFRNTLALSIRAAVLIAALLLLMRKPTLDFPSIASLTVLLGGLALLAMTGNRGHLVLVLLAIIALGHYLLHRLSMRFVVGAGLVLLLLYSVAGYARASQCDPDWAAGIEAHYGIDARLAPLAPLYLSIRSVPHYFERVTDRVPEQHSYYVGRALLSPLASVLPGHQPGIGEMVKDEILQLEFVGFGIAAGLFVPGYMDGGYGLVVLTLILAGAAMQWLYNRARSGRPEWLGVYAFAVANATLSVYGTLVNSFSVLLIPAIVFSVLWLSNRRIVLSLSPLEAVRAWPRVVVGVTGACLMGLILMTAVGFATASNLGTNQSDGGVMGHDGEEILIPATGC